MTDLTQKFEAATDANDHTLATMMLAEALGGTLGAAYSVILQEIADCHELQGHIEPSQQRLRDAIQAEILATLRLQGRIAA